MMCWHLSSSVVIFPTVNKDPKKRNSSRKKYSVLGTASIYAGPNFDLNVFK